MKLIINADDYGLTINVSKAIILGLKKGILTDTNAIVNTPDFKASAEMAQSHGIHEMGLHCLLTMGKPLSRPESIPSLVNEEGMFYDRKTFKNININIKEAEKEINAQIQTFLSSGLKLSHITTHHGFMNKSKDMTDLFIKLSKQYKVPLRNEASKINDMLLTEYYKKNEIVMPDFLYFNHGTPYHTVDNIKYFLNKMNGVYHVIEIGCHPGYSDDYLRKISPLNDYREKELKVVMDEDLKNYITQLNITRISFSDLKKEIL